MAVSEDAGVEPGAVRFEVTLPCDARFQPLRDCVVPRLTGYLGCDETDAVTRAVTLAVSAVLEHADGSVYSSVAIAFNTGEGVLTTRVRFIAEPDAPGAASAAVIERILNDGGSDAPLAVLRRLARRVEFGRVDGAECCTLVMPLPAMT